MSNRYESSNDAPEGDDDESEEEESEEEEDEDAVPERKQAFYARFSVLVRLRPQQLPTYFDMVVQR